MKRNKFKLLFLILLNFTISINCNNKYKCNIKSKEFRKEDYFEFKKVNILSIIKNFFYKEESIFIRPIQKIKKVIIPFLLLNSVQTLTAQKVTNDCSYFYYYPINYCNNDFISNTSKIISCLRIFFIAKEYKGLNCKEENFLDYESVQCHSSISNFPCKCTNQNCDIYTVLSLNNNCSFKKNNFLKSYALNQCILSFYSDDHLIHFCNDTGLYLNLYLDDKCSKLFESKMLINSIKIKKDRNCQVICQNNNNH